MSSQDQENQNWGEAHNAKVRTVWQAFHAGAPSRAPVALGTNARFFIFDQEPNPGEQLTFEDCSTDGVAMGQ